MSLSYGTCSFKKKLEGLKEILTELKRIIHEGSHEEHNLLESLRMVETLAHENHLKHKLTEIKATNLTIYSVLDIIAYTLLSQLRRYVSFLSNEYLTEDETREFQLVTSLIDAVSYEDQISGPVSRINSSQDLKTMKVVFMIWASLTTLKNEKDMLLMIALLPKAELIKTTKDDKILEEAIARLQTIFFSYKTLAEAVLKAFFHLDIPIDQLVNEFPELSNEHRKILCKELQDLLPAEVYVFPSTSPFNAVTLPGGHIAINKDCLSQPIDEKNKHVKSKKTAILMLLILHELANSKRLQIQGKNTVLKVPDRYDYEGGAYFEEKVFGYSLRYLIQYLEKDEADAILQPKTWENDKSLRDLGNTLYKRYLYDEKARLTTGTSSKKFNICPEEVACYKQLRRND